MYKIINFILFIAFIQSMIKLYKLNIKKPIYYIIFLNKYCLETYTF